MRRKKENKKKNKINCKHALVVNMSDMLDIRQFILRYQFRGLRSFCFVVFFSYILIRQTTLQFAPEFFFCFLFFYQCQDRDGTRLFFFSFFFLFNFNESELYAVNEWERHLKEM